MKKYSIAFIKYYEYEVEAETSKEAIKEAKELFYNDGYGFYDYDEIDWFLEED